MPILWRSDGQPVWKNPALIGREAAPAKATTADAQRAAIALAGKLGLDAADVIPAYEDPLLALIGEQKLPENFDPLKTPLAGHDDRVRVTRLLERGLVNPAGFVLPLRAREAPGPDPDNTHEQAGCATVWETSAWPLRRGQLYLLPSTHPVGVRLPLASLPEVLPGDIEQEFDVDPFAARGNLYDAHQLAEQKRHARKPSHPKPEPRKVVRTALCVEIQEGRLNFYLPPLKRLEDFLNLVAVIEAVAAAAGIPVRLEGYRGRLVYWNTQLHDRWMLPHFIEQDLRDVVRDLNAAGYTFDEAWFAPFLEFRFPRYGTVAYDGVRMELRQAIEPWHVMGEENTAGATARYVDSSVECLQVKVSGMTGTRHVVACNGRALPLAAAGAQGEFVAGVRYSAWDPPSALHPTIAVHSPLVFDIVDTWNNRSIGGATYHVVHSGGRNYDSFPVNGNEAEARRFARFRDHGHTPGPMLVKPELVNSSFPLTLDLRRSVL